MYFFGVSGFCLLFMNKIIDVHESVVYSQLNTHCCFSVYFLLHINPSENLYTIFLFPLKVQFL